MRALNRRYRKKARPPALLAFPLNDPRSAEPSRCLTRPPRTPQDASKTGGQPQALPSYVGDGPPMLLGDVVISVPTARRQAAELGHGLREELRRLLVHAVLHLMGYDHERGPRDAALMARKEQAILKALGGRVRVGVQEKRWVF